MKLPDFFSDNLELDIVRNNMGANLINFSSNFNFKKIHFVENKVIELEIKGVLDISASDFGKLIKDDVNGNLTLEGKLIVYYINNSNTTSDYKFHLRRCAAYNNNSYTKYQIALNPNGYFKINNKTNEVKLQVCRHCLRKSKYKNYNIVSDYQQDRIVNEFNFEEYKKINGFK